MSLDDIKQSILDEARKEVKQIEQDGQKQIDQVKNDWQQKLKIRKQELLAIAQRKADQKIQQTQFQLEAKSKTEVLTRKQKIINKVYAQVIEKLAELDDDGYVELMTKLITNLPEIEGELISVRDKEKLLKKALSKSSKKYKLADETINGKGGFRFTSKEIDIDNTFTALVNNAREQTILEVSDVLFGQGNPATS